MSRNMLLYRVKMVINLSPFGQVDEATFKKVRISFSDKGEILHVNTLRKQQPQQKVIIIVN